MSLEAKQNLIKHMEQALSETLTAASMTEVLRILTEELGGFSVEQITRNTDDAVTEEFLDAFLAAKQIEGRSEKTLTRYAYIIRRMLTAVKVPIREITIYHIRSYLMAEKKRGISDRTLEGNRSIYSSFFTWLFQEGLIARNPTGNLGVVKYTKKIRKPFSAVDLARLKEVCESQRDKAMVSFLLSTGCRISEVCALDRTISYQSGEITVLGKGAKERKVYVDDVTIMLLDRYLGERKDQSPALFVGKGTERITPNGVRRALKRLSIKAGVENVHPHRFRRTLATNLIGRGMEIQDVATILGHDKLDTTMEYVCMDQSAVKGSYKKFVS